MTDRRDESDIRRLNHPVTTAVYIRIVAHRIGSDVHIKIKIPTLTTTLTRRYSQALTSS